MSRFIDRPVRPPHVIAASVSSLAPPAQACRRSCRRTRRRRRARRRDARQRAADADRASPISSPARRARSRPRTTSRASSPTTCSARGLFAPINPAAFIEKITNTDAVPRFADWRVINAQALVTGRMTPAGRRQAQGRIPPVGRVRRPAARRQAVLHHAGQLAPHRAHHLRRDLRAADRREGLFRHPHRLRRRDRAEGRAASSASPSWTRTAPTCAI